MELKRILAKDIRRATEKAVALYGQDVLFVSNSRVNGMTEVIVAVDVAPEPWTVTGERGDGERFGQVLQQSFKSLDKGATASDEESTDEPEDLPLPSRKTDYHSGKRETEDSESSAQNARDYIRGREIVDLVRD